MKIEVEVELDDIIRKDLVDSALNMLDPEYRDTFETLDNKARLFSSLCEVIQFYSTRDEWDQFLELVKGLELK